MSARKLGRRAFTPPPPQRVRCLKDGGYCSERDWEGRCLDPKRGCEWNEVERVLARATRRKMEEQAGLLEETLREVEKARREAEGVAEGVSQGEEEGEHGRKGEEEAEGQMP